jgi:hypothetical protein
MLRAGWFEWRSKCAARRSWQVLGKTNGNPREIPVGRRYKPCFRNDGSVRLPYAETRAGLVLQQRGALIAPSARSGGLDDVDGSPDCRVYIQMCRIEQVCVLRPF